MTEPLPGLPVGQSRFPYFGDHPKMLVAALTVSAIVAVLQFFAPVLDVRFVSPLDVLLVCCVVASLANASKRAVLDGRAPCDAAFWAAVLLALLGVIAAEVIDVGIDGLDAVLHISERDNVPEIMLAAIGAGLLVLTPVLAGRQVVHAVSLLLLSAFGLVRGLPQALSDVPWLWLHIPAPVFEALTDGASLLCLLIFLFMTFAMAQPVRTTWEGTELLDQPPAQRDGAFVGSSSRQMFSNGGVELSPRHPPVAIAFRPGFQDVAFYLTLCAMLFWAGRPVKRGTGKSYLAQAGDMTRLWFRHRVDPPTYYAMDLYLPEHAAWVPHLLTRFETKNGLLMALNRRRPNPFPGHEMNDKQLFAAACTKAGISHAHTLMVVDGLEVLPQAPLEVLQQDLFCKPRKTMGAKDTLSFKWLGNGRYRDGHGHDIDVVGVFAALASKKKPMLVQPWLRNHAELDGFAKDSLLALRVVTVLNENDEPEVTMAMLRLLSKLEPDWQHLPDGEYAAPISLDDGTLGLFTGDNFKTALIRMSHHPVTGVAIAGKALRNWPAVRDLALKAHAAFKHRVIIGWDIALTPDGPVVLEGNTNLDVMFLQRVHNCPAGDTRFGALLNYHIQDLYRATRSA